MSDRKCTIYEATSRYHTGKGGNNTPLKKVETTLISYFKSKRFGCPTRSEETLEEYMNMPIAQRDNLKDVGGFVAATLDGGRKKDESVLFKPWIVLEYDDLTPVAKQKLIYNVITKYHYTACIYSTRKHTKERPRLRIVILLNRDVTPHDYVPIARQVAAWIGMDGIDPSCFDLSRLFYYPSLCLDSEYAYMVNDGDMVDADMVLNSYKIFGNDPYNPKHWPTAGKLDEPKKSRGDKQDDPETKPGIVGAFCREYDIYEAINTFLPDIYIPEDCYGNRYRLNGANSSKGAVVYEGGKFLYSNHATDPIYGKLVNSFDLVRLHKFGNEDNNESVKPGTPGNRLPSYKAMCELAESDPRVKARLDRERLEEVKKDFGGVATPPTDEELQRLLSYKGQIINMDIFRDVMSIFGYTIKRNVISKNVQITGLEHRYDDEGALQALPQIMQDNLESHGIKKASDYSRITRYLNIASFDCRYNPVREMFESVVWDGNSRLKEARALFLEDISDFEWSLLLKWFKECVAAVMYDPKNINDGLQLEYVATLQGPGGIGKSTFFIRFATIGGKHPEWFNENITIDVNNKDSLLNALGCWIGELAELDSTTNKRQPALKGFLSNKVDKIRKPYGREPDIMTRRTCFCGTVNPETFLNEATGKRRFWVIKVKRIDYEKLWKELPPEWFEQFWAEIYALWKVDPDFRLTAAELKKVEQANNDFEAMLPYEEEILETLDFDLPQDQWRWVKASTVKAFAATGERDATKIGKTLRAMVESGKYEGLETKVPRANQRLYLLPLKSVYTPSENG